MFSSINFVSVCSPQFGMTFIRTLPIPRNSHFLFFLLIFTSTATTTRIFHSAHLPLFHSCFHQMNTSSTSTSQTSFVRSSNTMILRNLWFHSQAVFESIASIIAISSALTHCLLVTMSHQIKKSARRGILRRCNTVQAVTHRVDLHQAQIRTLRFQCRQYFSLPHFGQSHPQCICSKYKRHCSSVWNESMNSIIFCGYCMQAV